MEYPCATTQCGGFCELETEAHSWIEIVMVTDIGLSLVAYSKRKVEFLAQFPVILQKRSQFKLIDVESRITLVLCERDRPAGNVVRQTRECECSDKIVLR